jgi:tRNA-dihydrouridine synthase
LGFKALYVKKVNNEPRTISIMADMVKPCQPPVTVKLRKPKKIKDSDKKIEILKNKYSCCF